MNMFVGVESPETANQAMIRANGMKAIVQADERTRFNNIGSETAGWLLFDEIDMVQGPRSGLSTLEAILAGLPQDGRFRYNNYGKGVLEWQTTPTRPGSSTGVAAQQLPAGPLHRFLLVHRPE